MFIILNTGIACSNSCQLQKIETYLQDGIHVFPIVSRFPTCLHFSFFGGCYTTTKTKYSNTRHQLVFVLMSAILPIDCPKFPGKCSNLWLVIQVNQVFRFLDIHFCNILESLKRHIQWFSGFHPGGPRNGTRCRRRTVQTLRILRGSADLTDGFHGDFDGVSKAKQKL